MAANVESMFYVRQAPWHGLGVRVEAAPSSEEALRLSGLDWQVVQQPIMTTGDIPIPGYKANLRDTDHQVLGVVTDRYRVVQNAEAFAFTDALLGEGVKYETAGSLQNGRKIWLLAKLPDKYIIEGDQVEPYLVFSNSHDGSGSIKVAMTPVRVVCQNTLNLALASAKRVWSMRIGWNTGKLGLAGRTPRWSVGSAGTNPQWSCGWRKLDSCPIRKQGRRPTGGICWNPWYERSSPSARVSR